MSKGSSAFEALVGKLNYPMFVVTTVARDQRSGCLVGFASQVSIEPPRFLAGISKKNHTYRVAVEAEYLAVHVLGREHLELAELFGSQTGDTVDKFTRCAWHAGPHDLPVLEDAAAWFSGRILTRLPVGDHVGFLVEPDAGEFADAAWPLVSFADVRDLKPGHDA
jgi:flavin reductase (DIM6/NTAB) family NADH-FMN oxidoreductase RutF